MNRKKETYAVWATNDIGETWNSAMEAEDIAEEAANKHQSKMHIFKLVKIVEPKK